MAELKDDVPFGKFLPNALTLVGLCCGATAIRFALSDNWEAAVIAIVCAAIFDMLDGRLARLFGADSAFGAQLDSLADLVSFGIAPSVVVYTWTLHEGGGAGWAAVLIFCACCALRLARFNVEAAAPHDEESPTPAHPYFTGLPTPAAACLILLPLLLSFQSGLGYFRDPLISGGMIALTSALMVSRVPTLSVKHLKITRQFRAPVMGLIALLLGSAVFAPWATMAACLIVYLAYIPVGAFTLGERKAKIAK
ncbi:MAG TPA: CDP-diacylglycerol--serine O-phosphatidyltransferase [Rhizomicrobium sp.]|nr:CDP-diacylglycerol--serine O-phosphatidyltransferase [Rhizomicrobium sp.]